MLDGQNKRVDITGHARTAHKGLQQKRLDENDSTIENMFYCAPALSKACLLFLQQFFILGLESVEDNSEHDLAGMAD